MAVTRGGEADKKCSLGIHLALVNFPPLLPVHDHPSKRTILCPTWLMHEKKSAAPFFIPFFFLFSSLLCREREKSMAGHEEAIGYVCFSGETSLRLHAARLTWAPFIPPPPRAPERTAHTGSIDSTPTHRFRQSRDLTVAAGVCCVV